VQADEIKVKTLMGSYWMALAMAVPTRLWLGGVVSRKRDLGLIQSLVDKVRAIALCCPLLLAAEVVSRTLCKWRDNRFHFFLPAAIFGPAWAVAGVKG
jgi:hypothetical protein